MSINVKRSADEYPVKPGYSLLTKICFLLYVCFEGTSQVANPKVASGRWLYRFETQFGSVRPYAIPAVDERDGRIRRGEAISNMQYGAWDLVPL